MNVEEGFQREWEVFLSKKLLHLVSIIKQYFTIYMLDTLIIQLILKNNCFAYKWDRRE